MQAAGGTDRLDHCFRSRRRRRIAALAEGEVLHHGWVERDTELDPGVVAVLALSPAVIQRLGCQLTPAAARFVGSCNPLCGLRNF